MSSYGYGSTTPTGIAVPAEFTLVPSLVDLLNTLDQVEHPRCAIAEPVSPYVAQPPKVVPAEALRAHLVSWHNQLVTVQRQMASAAALVKEEKARAQTNWAALQAANLTKQDLERLLKEARAQLAEQKEMLIILEQQIAEQKTRVETTRQVAGLKSKPARKAVKR
jgi:hypothetical protein